LHQAIGAIVVGRKPALRISVAIAARKAKAWARHPEFSDCREKPFHSAGDLHVAPRSFLLVH